MRIERIGGVRSGSGEHPPARSCVESRLMVDAKVEMDVIAYQPEEE